MTTTITQEEAEAEQQQHRTKTKVLIACFGSRGDVQPFAALGRGLQDYAAAATSEDDSGSSTVPSFEVLGITNINDGVSIFQSLNVKAVGCHFDMADFIRTNPEIKSAMETGKALQFGMAMGKEFSKRFPQEFCHQWSVAQEFQPDLIITTSLVRLQMSAIGQALRVPVIHADLGMFSFLPISHATHTELHEPACCHKVAAFSCVAGMLVPYKSKNSDGESLYGTIRRELASCIPDSEYILGQNGPGQYCREWMQPITIGLFAISNAVLPKSSFYDVPKVYQDRTYWTGNWFVSEQLQEQLAITGDPNFSNNTNTDTNTIDADASNKNSNNNNHTKDGERGRGVDTKQIVLDFLESQKQYETTAVTGAATGRGAGVAYIGWGSMVAVSPEHMTRIAVQSLQLANMSGIVLGGFAKLDITLLLSSKDTVSANTTGTDRLLYDYAKNRILFLQSAPHEWLFPKCSVTVHHGGAGTTAAALRSGVPTVVTPCIADQFDNAALIETSGCGIGFKKPLRDITSQELATALVQCSSSSSTTTRCNTGGSSSTFQSNSLRIAQALKEEDGIQNAIDAINTFIDTKLHTGQWKDEFNKRLEQRAKEPWSFMYACYRMMCYNDPFHE